jgi:hypothetical protein
VTEFVSLCNGSGDDDPRDTGATCSPKILIYQTSFGAFDSAIPWFESRRPSQPVRSPSGASKVSEDVRYFKGVTANQRVSVTGICNQLCKGLRIQRRVSARDFSISGRERPRLGSTILRLIKKGAFVNRRSMQNRMSRNVGSWQENTGNKSKARNRARSFWLIGYRSRSV